MIKQTPLELLADIRRLMEKLNRINKVERALWERCYE